MMGKTSEEGNAVRHILIDTDTGSDDAVAIVMALHCPGVRVEAITAVAGNVPLEQAGRNARIAVEWAGPARPPVYLGCGGPMLRELTYAYETHGRDGMGYIGIPDPQMPLAAGHGADVIIELARRFVGELEIVALGPLTNLALALLREPRVAGWVKQLTVMGSAGFGPGNVTPTAEFNIWADPEACAVVLRAGIPQLYAGWDLCCGEAVLTEGEIEGVLAEGSTCAQLCIRCNRCLMELNTRRFGSPCLDMADPVAMAVALWPELVKESLPCFSYVNTGEGLDRGQLVFDWTGAAERPANAAVVRAIHIPAMKRRLLEAIA